MAYSYRNSLAGAWGTSHGRAPPFNTSSELQSHLAGVNWADVSDSRANPRPYNEPSLDSNLQPMGPGYRNVPTNPDPFRGTELQSQQSIDDIARQLRAEQSIDVFSERAPWFPGSRVPVRFPSVRNHALLTTSSLIATNCPNRKMTTPTCLLKANTFTMRSQPRPFSTYLHDPVPCQRTHGQHRGLATTSHPHHCRRRRS
jgi:hypothetical protein